MFIDVRNRMERILNNLFELKIKQAGPYRFDTLLDQAQLTMIVIELPFKYTLSLVIVQIIAI